jgi:hypothetical protein
MPHVGEKLHGDGVTGEELLEMSQEDIIGLSITPEDCDKLLAALAPLRSRGDESDHGSAPPALQTVAAASLDDKASAFAAQQLGLPMQQSYHQPHMMMTGAMPPAYMPVTSGAVIRGGLANRRSTGGGGGTKRKRKSTADEDDDFSGEDDDEYDEDIGLSSNKKTKKKGGAKPKASKKIPVESKDIDNNVKKAQSGKPIIIIIIQCKHFAQMTDTIRISVMDVIE